MQLAQFFTNEKKIRWASDVILYGSANVAMADSQDKTRLTQDF
jgi:hypothetical protein